MNTLRKLSMGGVLGVLGLVAAAAPVGAGEVFGVTVPDLSAITSEVSKVIAAEVRQQLSSALRAPREARIRRPPSVTVTETTVVVVEASRLPPLDGSVDEHIRTAEVRRSVRF